LSDFSVYDATGLVLRSGTCQPDDLPLQAGPGEFALEGRANDLLEYVVGGVIQPRPVMSVLLDVTTVPADGLSEATFTGVPTGAAVTVRGPATDAFTVPDGELVMTFDVPGTYRVSIEKFPFRDFEATCDAT
jgi:hypothetical protein